MPVWYWLKMQQRLNSQALLSPDPPSQLSSASLIQTFYYLPTFSVPLISFIPRLAATKFATIPLSIASAWFHLQDSDINAWVHQQHEQRLNFFFRKPMHCLDFNQMDCLKEQSYLSKANRYQILLWTCNTSGVCSIRLWDPYQANSMSEAEWNNNTCWSLHTSAQT